MAKVTFDGERGHYDVLVDGVKAARISGSSGEYYLETLDRKFIARFKYVNALASAKHFAKFALAQLSADAAAGMSADASPLTWAKALGYVSYNVVKLNKRKACDNPITDEELRTAIAKMKERSQ